MMDNHLLSNFIHASYQAEKQREEREERIKYWLEMMKAWLSGLSLKSDVPSWIQDDVNAKIAELERIINWEFEDE